MNNFQRGEKLLSQAEGISRELTNVFERNLPNLVVRRAQEVVEISLKALLKMPLPFILRKIIPWRKRRKRRKMR
ncbi:hypothetical protein CEE35_01150 [Candidatus Aerophobetes bacterium Ae_b3b]|nr:MAG: hypothetical protein CEE35_01150 [Candidatus Aerophobetes bacterium Ae_b3b]